MVQMMIKPLKPEALEMVESRVMEEMRVIFSIHPNRKIHLMEELSEKQSLIRRSP
jgi:hypothetical protein